MADFLTGDEILWKRLSVVENDKYCWLGDAVRDAVESERDVAGLLERGRLHGVAPFGEVSRQDLGHENVFVPGRVWRGILVLDRQDRVDGEVHALTVDGGCEEKLGCQKRTRRWREIKQNERKNKTKKKNVPFFPQKLRLKPWTQISFTLPSLVP